MCKSLMSFSSGVLVGFIAGVLIDNKKRTKIQEIVKSQSSKIKSYEKTLLESIDKLKNVNQAKPKSNK